MSNYMYVGYHEYMIDEDPNAALLIERLRHGRMTSCKVDNEDEGEHGLDLNMSVTFDDGSTFYVMLPNICAPGDFYKGDVDSLTEHLMDVMEFDC